MMGYKKWNRQSIIITDDIVLKGMVTMVRRKKINIILIIIAILLVLGIVVVYIIGEKRLKESQKKDYLGADEVNAEIIDIGESEAKRPEMNQIMLKARFE